MADVSADVLVAPAGVGVGDAVADGRSPDVVLQFYQATAAGFPVGVSARVVECRLLIDLILTWSLLIGWFFWVSLQQALLGPAQRLPVSQHRIFVLCVDELRRGMLLLAGVLGFLGALVAVFYEGRFLWRPGLVFGCFHAVNVFALTMAWAGWAANRPARASKLSGQTQGLVLLGIMFGSFWLTMFWPTSLNERQLARFVEPIYAALPGGWVGEPFCRSLTGPLTFTWAVLPTVLLALLAPVWLRRVRARFIRFAPDHQFILRPDEVPATWTREQVEEELRQRLHTPADWWQSGWTERLVARALSTKERELAEVLFPGAPGWSRIYWRFVMGIMLLLALGWLLQPTKLWAALFLYLFAGLGLWFFRAFFTSAGGPGMLGELPFQLPPTARQYTGVWLKLAWIRSLCALPVFLFAGFFWKTAFEKPLVDPVSLVILLWMISGPAHTTVKPLSRILLAFRAAKRWQKIGLPLGIMIFFLPLFLLMWVILPANWAGFGHALRAVALAAMGLNGLLMLVNRALQKQWFDFAASDATTTANGFRLKNPALQRDMAMAQRPGDFP